MKLTSRSGATLAITAAAMLLSGAAMAPVSAAEGGKVHCMGVNACKGTGACKTADNSCKGTNACKGKGMMEMTAKDCKAKGGKEMKS